jgi:hypothetical protein
MRTPAANEEAKNTAENTNLHEVAFWPDPDWSILDDP